MTTPRKTQFFAESLRLIHDRGFKGTTMRDIAMKMDCDVANLYNFVKSKQEILDLSLFGINEEFHNGIDAIIQSGYSPIAKLKRITQLYVRLSFEKPYQISLLVSGWRHLSASRKADFLRERAAYESKVRQVIEEGIAIGEMKPIDPILATYMVLSAMRWLFDKSMDNSSALNPIEVERQINEFVISGIEL